MTVWENRHYPSLKPSRDKFLIVHELWRKVTDDGFYDEKLSGRIYGVNISGQTLNNIDASVLFHLHIIVSSYPHLITLT